MTAIFFRTLPGFSEIFCPLKFITVKSFNCYLLQICIAPFISPKMNISTLLKESKILQGQKEDEHTWLKIDANLLNLASVVKKQDTDIVLAELQPLITRSILSERSKVSGTALVLLKACINLNPAFDLNLYVDPLFKLCGRSNRVFSMRGEEVLLLLADKISKPMSYFKEYSGSNNKNVRLCTYKTMEVFLRGIFKTPGENTKTDEQVNCVLKIVEGGISDAHYDCRVVCKRILKEFRGSDVEIREEKGPITIRRPARPINERISTLASIGQKAKAAIELLGRYSPFRKQSKTNDNKAVKIERDELKNSESDGVRNLIKMSEAIPEDIKGNHTPKKLQDYIDKYKDHSFIDKKYLEKDASVIESCEIVNDIQEAKMIFDNIEKEDKRLKEQSSSVHDNDSSVSGRPDDHTDNLLSHCSNVIKSPANSTNGRGLTTETNDLIFKNDPNSSVLGRHFNLKDEEDKIEMENNYDDLANIEEPAADKPVFNDTEICLENEGLQINIEETEKLKEFLHFPVVAQTEDEDFINREDLSVMIDESFNQVKDDEDHSIIDENINVSIHKLSLHDNLSVGKSIIENADKDVSNECEKSVIIPEDYTVIEPKVYAKREFVVKCEEDEDENMKSA